MQAPRKYRISDQVSRQMYSRFERALRKKRSCLEKEIMQRTTSGQRRRERSKTSCENNITIYVDRSKRRCNDKIIGEQKTKWRMIVHEGANFRI